MVWSPHYRGDIARIERVLRLYTKRIPNLRSMSYPERLACLEFKSLEHRRVFHDMIFLYKIIHGLCAVTLLDIQVSVGEGKYGLRAQGFA